MPKGSPFSLSTGRTWPNKTAAKRHFSEMLNRHSLKQTVGGAQDHDDLLNLVSQYDGVSPDWAGAKTGVGVASFFKDLDDDPDRAKFGTSCFYVVRTDESRVHFSTNKAVDAIAAASTTPK